MFFSTFGKWKTVHLGYWFYMTEPTKNGSITFTKTFRFPEFMKRVKVVPGRKATFMITNVTKVDSGKYFCNIRTKADFRLVEKNIGLEVVGK